MRLKPALALLLFFGLGVLLGRAALRSPGPTSAVAPGPPNIAAWNGPTLAARAPASATTAEAAPAPETSIDPELLLAAVLASRDPSLLAGFLGDDGSGVPARVIQLIEQLTDAELVGLVTSFAPYSAEELLDRRDLRGFVQALSAIVLEGAGPEGGEAEGDDVREGFVYPHLIEFSDEASLAPDNSTTLPQQVFNPGAEKIYAVFPTEGYPYENVLVRWRRTDQRYLMLLDRYPIHTEDSYSYVWLREPAGWPEGNYQVSIFSDGEQPLPFAVGEYDIEAQP